MTLSSITPTLSMLITLGIAYGIDQWLHLQERYARQNSNFAQWFKWVILGGLVMCAVWLALSWIVLVKNRRSPAVSILFIVIGFLSFIWLPLQIISPYVAIHLYLFRFPVNNFQYSGLFIALLGFLALLLPKQDPAISTKQE